MKNIFALKITEQSAVSEARRLTTYAATAIGFNETDKGRISIIVTELCRNLVKHTSNGGEFLLFRIKRGHMEGLELLAIDKSPGIRNIAEAMRDGFSTAGSPGTGLGSIKRLSDFFDIYSLEGLGTVILSRIWLNKPALEEQTFEISGINLPKPGQEVSGDKWAWRMGANGITVMIADGLGHGLEASDASNEAIKAFEETSGAVDKILNSIHLRLGHTRGAAVAICELETKALSVKYCGVGNISGVIISPLGSRSMISHNGIVGHEARRMQVFEYPWTKGALLVMHSDGMSARWNMDKYPGLFMKSTSVICGVLYRDFSRGNDDFTVVAMRML
ncbi:MAG: SpoIIE family protein phosphatase [Ignavibacteria bacterium]|jgi:anti-sigma regulatory factor (Ser/Thr protein kinase)|nr:SpoIIE family protein phosphatase [Ignavibacteria bacterium]MCU7504719.1 SpoIIE family protein phosphatase [Ignavibacteria bacterium]MCU7516321.1 SpoIIE family protein phosphatase [Ignavibacteria bacterium]